MNGQRPYSTKEISETERSDVPRVLMRGIVKRFPGLVANDGINLEVRRGEIHCLLGENGAGKTTLMRILYGLYQPDAGEIFVNGKQVRITSPYVALAHGIGMIHQHFRLVPTLSVEKNIVLGLKEQRGPFLRFHEVRRKIQIIADKYGLEIDPQAKVWQLSVGQQERVEILKALYRQATILIMDEPTSVLTPQETERLFATLRSMVDAGLSIIFITHKLDEVMAISDRVTVLRNGKVAGTSLTSRTDKRALVQMMVGRELDPHLERSSSNRGKKVLEVRDLHAQSDRGLPALQGVSFKLYSGEILGIAGVSGNGQKELVQILVGMRRGSKGQIFLNGKDVTGASPSVLLQQGLGYIPADRAMFGIARSLSLEDNLILKSYRNPAFQRGPLLNRQAVHKFAKQLITEFDVKSTSPKMLAGQLSGGNQQRLLIARELSRRPSVLVANQPTRGLDVAATEYVHNRLVEARNNGSGIVLLSDDLDEILALSDRIMVIYKGNLVKPQEVTRYNIGLLMTGGTV